MDARQPPKGTRAAPSESAAAEERRLWQLISDPQAQPIDRLKAYVRWLEIGRASRQHGDAPAPPEGPDGPT
jgi:hypothetical protein